MDPAAFIRKWRDVALPERSACHEHFLDLWALAAHPTPVEMDKTGDSFTFERGAAKEGGGQGGRICGSRAPEESGREFATRSFEGVASKPPRGPSPPAGAARFLRRGGEWRAARASASRGA
jgi:hypothetical protein